MGKACDLDRNLPTVQRARVGCGIVLEHQLPSAQSVLANEIAQRLLWPEVAREWRQGQRSIVDVDYSAVIECCIGGYPVFSLAKIVAAESNAFKQRNLYVG